jgi:hypothetical protein
MKLSWPQQRMLEWLDEHDGSVGGRMNDIGRLRSAESLVRLGFAKRAPNAAGARRFPLTEAGLAALAALRKGSS